MIIVDVNFQVVGTLPKSGADWKSISIKFWPNETFPTHIRLAFENGNGNEIVAKLPADHNATQMLVSVYLKS